MGDLKIIRGNSNPQLANEIANELGEEVCDAKISKFPDGEIYVHIQETVRGKHVYVIQPVAPPVNDSFMELMLMIDALKRASAKRIAAVVPYYGYARQDRKQTGRVPISAKMVANMISTAGADRVLTLDLHSGQIQGFFDIPVDNLRSDPIFADFYSKYKDKKDEVAVVSPDVGGAKKARKLARKLNLPLAIVEKIRDPEDKTAHVMNLIGDVAGKKCIISDDLISTGGTLIKVSEQLKEKGSKSIEAICTHGLFTGEALNNLKESPIKSITVTNTIQHEQARKSDFVNYISVGNLFANTIKRIYNKKSVSKLFPHS